MNGLLLVTVGFLFSSCNGVFYQPDNVIYGTPDQVGITYRELAWTTSDHETLQAWELLPATGRTKATVLHFHGNAQNRSAHFFFVHWLTERGFRVIAFDYRGYDGSSGTPSRSGLLEDGKTAIAATCKAYAQEAPVFLFAQSLGGAVALPALASLPASCIQGVILDSTFASYRDLARSKLGSIWLTWPLQYPLSYLVSDDLNPIDAARHIDLPTLAIHGTADPVVPIEQGLPLYQALPQLELWTVPDSGHTEAIGDKRSPYREKLVTWLQKMVNSPHLHSKRGDLNDSNVISPPFH